MSRTTWKPGDGLEAALEVIDGPPQLAEDHVPTVDQAAPVSTYRDWDKADTRVVTYAVNNTVYRGKYAESREHALADCQAIHGRVLEANYMPGRAFFRVFKVRRDV